MRVERDGGGGVPDGPAVPGADAWIEAVVDGEPHRIRKQVVRAGAGGAPLSAPAGAEVYVHYEAYDGALRLHDSSVDRDYPYHFTLGESHAAPLWEAAVASMAPGEKAVFHCEAGHLYRPFQQPPTLDGAAGTPLTVYVEYVRYDEWSNVVHDGRIRKKKLDAGSREIATPNDASVVHVTYTGRRPDGTVFADAHDAVLTIGKDDLLEGLELAIKSMCRGEHSLFHVDPSYAYGRAGCPDLGIAADAALDYDVHLLSFEAGTLKWEMSTEAKVDLAECRKAHGNAAYKAGQIERAERLYDQCLELVNYEGEQAAASRIVAIRIATWNNLAAIKTKREAYAEAIALAGKVLALDPGNGKARYRRALCYMRTTQPDLALDDVDEALRSDPTSASLLALQAIARKHLAQAARKQAKQFGGWCDRLSLDTTTTNSSSSSSAAPRQDAPGSAPSPTK
ncbi:peptidylprolyl isomerase [Plasmodiophora brassicae]